VHKTTYLLVVLTFVTLSGFSPLTCQEVRVTKWDLLEGLSTAQDLFDCVFVNDSIVVAERSNVVVRRGVPTVSFPDMVLASMNASTGEAMDYSGQ